MKRILAALLLLTSSFVIADEPIKQFVQFDKSAVVAQALEYLKKARPDLDIQKCELHSVQFSYHHKSDDSTLSVSFKLLDSETKVVEDGRNCLRHQLVDVTFPRTAFPEASISDATSTEYGDVVK